MKLRFLGKESKPNDSPTLYATDRGSYIVQGYIVTDPAILILSDLADDETLVEVPARLMVHLNKDGNDFWLFDTVAHPARVYAYWILTFATRLSYLLSTPRTRQGNQRYGGTAY